MPKRYLISALAIIAAGVATAAASITITASQSKVPQPTMPPSQLQDEKARSVWRTTPVETLLPATLDRLGGEKYVRLGIADAAGCSVLPGPFVDALAKAAPETTCVKVLRATYTDSTQTVLATVGIVVIGGTAEARDKVWREWTPDADAHRIDLMPSVLPEAGTVAAGFADSQRIVWDSDASADGSYLVYAVSAFADGRPGSTAEQLRAGTDKALSADSPPVQAALDLPQIFAKALTDAEPNAGKKP